MKNHSPEFLERVSGLLGSIRRGDVRLRFVLDNQRRWGSRVDARPYEVYCGNCEYVTQDGWRIVVFNDCNAFDYFDSITSPEGESADFDEMCCKRGSDEGGLDAHWIDLCQPDARTAWLAYGIPPCIGREPEAEAKWGKTWLEIEAHGPAK